jgi:hypothetical protein
MLNSTNFVEFWKSTMAIPEARWIVLLTILVVAILIGVYVSIHFRNMALGNSEVGSEDHLSQFRKMRDEGQLDDAEFARLKQLMRQRQLDENSTGQPQALVIEKRVLTLAQAEQLKRQRLAQSEEGAADTLESN